MKEEYKYDTLMMTKTKQVVVLNFLSPFGTQQSIEEELSSELGQLFDPQNKWFLHSPSKSQSPSLTSQGLSVVQKSSFPLLAS